MKKGDCEAAETCAIRVDTKIASFVVPFLKAAPGLYSHPYQLAASVSLAQNIGAGNLAASTVARRFNARDWAADWTALALSNDANGKVVVGLVNPHR